MKEVFISYHTSSAIDIVKKLVAALEDAYDVQGDEWFSRLCEGEFGLIFTTRYHQSGSR